VAVVGQVSTAVACLDRTGLLPAALLVPLVVFLESGSCHNIVTHSLPPAPFVGDIPA
ncbi:hypothetical protein TNCV_4422691, partial [Trichonephila clavipes]